MSKSGFMTADRKKFRKKLL